MKKVTRGCCSYSQQWKWAGWTMKIIQKDEYAKKNLNKLNFKKREALSRRENTLECFIPGRAAGRGVKSTDEYKEKPTKLLMNNIHWQHVSWCNRLKSREVPVTGWVLYPILVHPHEVFRWAHQRARNWEWVVMVHRIFTKCMAMAKEMLEAEQTSWEMYAMAQKSGGGYQEQREHLNVSESWCLTIN